MSASSWRLRLNLNEYLTSHQFGRFDAKLRIPVSGSILLNKEVREIIDTQDFQRLRGIRQQGASIFVFPGANHTRFEHSLGTYFLALRYIEKLIKLPFFSQLCRPVDETIKLITLASLLHDIGHYPYSHWIEEIKEFPKGIRFLNHEQRARQIICEGDIRRLIQDRWEVDPQIVANIISSKYLLPKEALMNSIINSLIDVDKIDYLVRDSVHCGVDYGMGIDVERLLDSLYVYTIKVDEQIIPKIGLTEKGRSCLLSILACRNIMYQEVYWHKTVRACDAMFKRFFYDFTSNCNDDIALIKQYLTFSDDLFIATLYDRSRTMEINKLLSPFALKGRSLYKPVYIVLKSNVKREKLECKTFLDKVFSFKTGYKDLVKMSENVALNLKKYIASIRPIDIIIETAPVRPQHEKYGLLGFQIWNSRMNRYEPYPGELDHLNKYLVKNRQAYIFCSPEHYTALQKLVPTRRFTNILEQTAEML